MSNMPFTKTIKHTSFLKTYCKFLMAEIVNASIWLTIFSCLATIIETSLGYFLGLKQLWHIIRIEHNRIGCLQYQTKMLWGRAQLFLTNPRIPQFCVANGIPARYHTFVEIDHELISTVILLPSAESFKKGCCQLQAKVCAWNTG